MSKDCDEALANLYTYLDAEIDDLSRRKIRDHLDVCNGCNGPFDFETRLRHVIRERLDEEVPQSFVDKLRAALAEESRPQAQ